MGELRSFESRICACLSLFIVFFCSQPAVAATPTVTLTADPTSTRLGESVTLTWSTINAGTRTASGGWSGSKATSGSEVVTPMQTTSYTLTCTSSNNITVSKTVTVTVDSGMAITRIEEATENTITDPQLDAVVWRVGWKEFQPNSSLDAETSFFEEGIAAAAANGKLAILQLDFAPAVDGHAADFGSNNTNIPQWAKDQGVQFVIIRDRTNEFPVWWDPTYKELAKNAITELTEAYNGDPRVAGYVITGASGVLPTSLAGEQSDALLSEFIAEGFVPNPPGAVNVDQQLPSQGYNYGIAVRDIMTHWAISTSKPVAYISRPPDSGNLAEELEEDPVGLYPHVAVVDNGFRQCDGQDNTTPRFQALQEADHIVGWWDVAPNGFTTDTLSSAIICAAGSFDRTKLWFCFDHSTWSLNPDAVPVANAVVHPSDTTAPSMPTGLNATAVSDSQIDLSWKASTGGVAGYKIFRDGVQVGDSKLLSFSDIGLAEAITYTYAVLAYDSAGNKSAQSLSDSATTIDVHIPSKPTGLAATAVSGSQVNLSWIAPSDNVGVTGYKVYRDGVEVGTSSGTTYSDTGLAQATSYTYTVAAHDAAGNTSLQSGSATAKTFDVTAPSKPTGLTATPVGGSKIDLAWTASTDNVAVTGYQVYRNALQVATKTTTSYSDSGLTEATSYTYTVAAYDAAGNVSAPSSSVAAKTLDVTAPSKPTGLTATAVSGSQINLSWTASTDNVGVTSYKIYGGGVQIATTTGTTFSNTGLAQATGYNYTVAACDAAENCSGQSSAATAMTLDLTAPSVPTGLKTTFVSSTKISISWTASTDNVAVTGYNVYRNGVQVTTRKITSYSNTNLTPNTRYTFTVSAYDAAGNTSAQSTSITVKTSP